MICATDYPYEANGNLLSDGNKGMTVAYNELNLPVLVDFGQGRRIAWLYDASGRKLRKRVTDGTAEPLQIDQRDYVDGFVYQDGDLEFFPTAEGRVVPDADGFRYEYFYSDHLGNTRMRFSDMNGDGVADVLGEVLQEDAYYPYGMRLQGIGGAVVGVEELRLFNGIERQEEFGLFWYQMNFRMLDSEIGRWNGIDPKADEREGPYVAMGGNPIIFSDIKGDTIRFANGVSEEFKSQFYETVIHLYKHDAVQILEGLHNRKETIVLQETNSISRAGKVNGSYIIEWNPKLGIYTNSDVVLSPATALVHEADHMLHRLEEPEEHRKQQLSKDPDYDNLEEKRVITGSEQMVARALGEIGPKEVTRTDHGGIPHRTIGPTTTKTIYDGESIKEDIK